MRNGQTAPGLSHANSAIFWNVSSRERPLGTTRPHSLNPYAWPNPHPPCSTPAGLLEDNRSSSLAQRRDDSAAIQQDQRKKQPSVEKPAEERVSNLNPSPARPACMRYRPIAIEISRTPISPANCKQISGWKYPIPTTSPNCLHR